MILKNKRNHYNVKLLRGYGVSISPKNQKILEKSFKKWASGFWNIYTDKHNKKLNKANEMWDHFKTKRKVGRPKQKRTRGRPKDTGI